MLLFIARRLVWAGVLAVVITLVTFVIFFMVPNNGATLRVGRGSLARSLQTQFSLQGSLPEQYAKFVGHLLNGDFGRSTRTRDQASDVIKNALPVTASLVIGGTLMFLLIAIPIGILSALRPRSRLDRGSMVFVLIGVSVHPVWLAFVFSYVFGAKLHWFPVGDYCNFFADPHDHCGGAVDWARHMMLPWLTYAFLFAALYARMLRAAIIELLEDDFVRTAYAKGSGTARVIRKHVLPNAVLPMVAMLGMDIGVAFAGSLFIESAYGLPGLGQLLYASATASDLPVVMGVMIVVSLAVAFCTVLADVIVCILDPRTNLRSSRDPNRQKVFGGSAAPVPQRATSTTGAT